MHVAANDGGHVRAAALRLLWTAESSLRGMSATRGTRTKQLMWQQGEPDENTRLIRPDPENEMPV